MNYWQLIKDLDRKRLKPVYHFTGDEEFSKNQAISKLITTLIPPNLKDFNLNQLYCSQLDIDQIINYCSTFPLNNPKRLVVLHESDKLSPKGKERLLGFLPSLPKTTCLVLCSPKVRLDNKFYRDLGQIAETVKFDPIYDENQISNWISDRVRAHNLKIDRQALELLQDRVGRNLPDLANEIEKLCSLVGKRGKIESDDVRIVVGETKGANVFELTDCVGNKNLPSSLSVLNKLFLSGEKPSLMIYWLAKHFIRLIKTKTFSPKEKSVSLSALLRINPFFVKNYKSQAGNFSLEELKEALLLLHKADLEIKSSRLPNRLALELLIYRLCSLKEGISAHQNCTIEG